MFIDEDEINYISRAGSKLVDIPHFKPRSVKEEKDKGVHYIDKDEINYIYINYKPRSAWVLLMNYIIVRWNHFKRKVIGSSRRNYSSW